LHQQGTSLENPSAGAASGSANRSGMPERKVGADAVYRCIRHEVTSNGLLSAVFIRLYLQ
jgi:hypothetical protein